MATTAPCQSSIPAKPTYSCIRCASRKVKCDRNIPCSACTRQNIDCVYNASQPPRNRRRHLNTKFLTDRLRHYEALLREKGIELDGLERSPSLQAFRQASHVVADDPNNPQWASSPVAEPERNRSAKKGRLIQSSGQARLIDNVLWKSMAEELHDSHDTSGDSSNALNDPYIPSDDLDLVLGGQAKSNLGSFHPPTEGIHQLWQIFKENIDPLTKVLHVPTMQLAIEKAAIDIGAVPRTFEALLFAVYSVAVMSLTDEECMERLGESRKILLSQYISATKQALSLVKFMQTASLVVLQALFIHLLSVRDFYEPRAVWSLTGVAIRIAQGMGLDRDGLSLGLSPFETEIRRRIWWQLKMHDFRTAELCGMRKFADLQIAPPETTEWPSNVNDDQLYPGMPSPAVEVDKTTDAIFVSLKCELLKYAADRVTKLRNQGKTSTPWDPQGSDTVQAEESSGDIEELLESKYLRYCDPSQPLHLMVMLMARCSINIIRFMTHHPRRWPTREQIPLSERQLVWDICVRLLEQHNMLQCNSQLRQFAWYAPYYQQWHAIIHVLDTLQANPLQVDGDKAWKQIGIIYENNPEMSIDTRKPIYIPVGNLCLKAYDKREAALKSGSKCIPPIPRFIEQLRQRKKSPRSVTQESKGNSVQSKTRASDVDTDSLNKDAIPNPKLDVRGRPLGESLISARLEQYLEPLPPSLAPDHTHHTRTLDPFWFVNGFDYTQNSDGDDANMQLGPMTNEKHYAEDDAMDAITWDQWESWVADSDMIGPLSLNNA